MKKNNFIKKLLESINNSSFENIKNIVKNYLIENENNSQIREVLSLSNENDIQKYVKKNSGSIVL